MFPTHIVLTVSGGVLTGAVADGPISVTVVDHDNIKAGDPFPTLPPGITRTSDDDLTWVSSSGWRAVL
jgi:hypothetical protein